MSFLTRLMVRLSSRQVGTDSFGNTYWQSRKPMTGYERHRRFVLYAGEPEASKVPPEWHAWLHHLTDAPLSGPKRPWMLQHQPNMTGTALAYRPAGHDYAGGQRQKTAGDYEAWTPGS